MGGNIDLVRRATQRKATCDWCGQKRKPLFEYGHQTPMLRTTWEREVFCNQQCRSSYVS